MADETFSNLDLLVLVSCQTGKGREETQNFVNSMHSKGAKIVVGFEESVYNIEMDAWLISFFEELSSGKSIEEACDIAQIEAGNALVDAGHSADLRGSDTYYIAGDEDYCFN